MKQIFLAAGLMVFTQMAMAFSYTLEISEQELQEKVSAMMPMKKKRFFLTVILSRPDVDLAAESNEISIFSHIDVLAPGGIKEQGDVKISGTLSYDADKGEFFFHNPSIPSLAIKNIPDKFIPEIKKITELIAGKILSKHPIYKLRDDNLKHKLAKAVLKSVTVKNEQLQIVLDTF